MAKKADKQAAKERKAEQKAKKPSFFARLFGVFKRKPMNAEIPIPDLTPPAPAPTETPAETPARPAQARLVSRSALQEQPEQPQAQPAPEASPPHQEAAPPSAPLPVAKPVRPVIGPLPPPSDRIRILVVDDIPQTRSNVVRALRFQEGFEVVGTANNGQQGMQLAFELQPDVIIMDVNMPGMDGIAATGQIKRELPATEIIIMTVQDDVDYMRGAMAAGARDFLAKPPMVDELITAVKRAGALAIETKNALRPLFERSAAATAQVIGKVITVYSPRGGAGCTTLAVNLAAALHSAETPVVLIDGDLQFGDIPLFLNTQSRHTIFDLAPRVEELDTHVVAEALAQHQQSGIHLLAPPRPEQAETINSWQFNQIVKYLRGLYAYVIIDTSCHLTDITLAALDICDIAIVLATQDIPAIARLRQFLDLAPALELDKSNTLLVINAYTNRIGISPEQIGKVLKHQISGVIPMDKAAAILSMNRGTPFMLQNEAASRPIVRAIQELKNAILERLEKLEQALEGEEENSKR